MVLARDTPDPRMPLPALWVGVGYLVAAGLWVITATEYNQLNKGTFSALLLAALVVAPVLLMRRRPALAWQVSFVGLIIAGVSVNAMPDAPWPWHPAQILVALLAFGWFGIHRRRAELLWALVLTGAVVIVFVKNPNSLAVMMLVLAVTITADQIRRRREAQRGLVEEEARTEQEKARRAVLEERTRIARELHDVVAHHMSLIVVRAETAPYRLDGMPDEAREEFAGIAAASREALTEMRRLLGVLRSEDAEGADPSRAPQPQLDDVAVLVETARAAGVDITLTLTGDRASVPSAVQLTAYRIVQEALSNATRHAPGAPVRVSLDVWPDRELRLLVANDVDPAPNGPVRPGLGLAGMRERATALGGRLTAGPGPDGFAVRATLPLTDDPLLIEKTDDSAADRR
ncbi:two-component sensor histidine kinase [Virgisporangium aliadipatigenens]|uniref:histidine kinase n=1 Tax=Virgisporangium aliadipatigenens TaxID=741659 RepID=A0A8J4DQV1_9ACTN|nr:two-component sensor histidine kinase [Virgisporangium aliadipatigenens]